MKEQKYKTDKQSNGFEIKPFLHQQLQNILRKDAHYESINELVHHYLEYREKKAFIHFTSFDTNQYLLQHWKHFYEQNPNQIAKQVQNSENTNEKVESQAVNQPQLSLYSLVLQAAIQRQGLIENQIRHQSLKIQRKKKPIKLQKNDQNNINQQKQLKESKASQTSQKDFSQFIKSQKMQKQKRKKLLQKQLERQFEIQKQKRQQEQKKRQSQRNDKKESKRKRQKQIVEKRQREKQLIKKHQSLYQEFQTKLFHLKQKQADALQLLNRFDTEEIKRLEGERQKLYKSFEKPKIDEHEKRYLQNVSKRKEQRYKRFEEMKKIQQIQKQQSRVKFYSSYKFERPQEEYERKKRQEYEKAKEKRDRILLYKNKVKSSYVPEVDQQKKNELMRLIEDLQSGKRVKKRVLKNGQRVLQKLQIKDTRQIGLNYLEDVKKKVERMRQIKRENSNFDQPIESNQETKEVGSKKPIDYLRQLRESRSNSMTSAFSTPRKTLFGNTKRSEMSFDEKLRKIESISHKLMQKTKQQEMLLKYGKFRTPQQILDKKQMIDRNYIDLVNMKLKMIQEDQAGYGNSQTQKLLKKQYQKQGY